MIKFSRQRNEKIEDARSYLKEAKDEDSLYALVLIMGPTCFGEIINANSSTVWHRVAHPESFKLVEVEMLSDFFNVSFDHFKKIIQEQRKHNTNANRKAMPIGKKKYELEILPNRTYKSKS